MLVHLWQGSQTPKGTAGPPVVVSDVPCQSSKSYPLTVATVGDGSCDALTCVPTGTRNAVLNTEARTVDADVLSRRCVLMRLLDFSYEHYQKALRQSAGAVVIILPRAMAAVPQDVVRVSLSQSPCLPSGCVCCVSLRTRGLPLEEGS